MRRLLALLAVAVASAAFTSSASANVKWLCKPGIAKNPCTPSLRTTVFSSFGARTGIQTPKATKPKVDCFYVYPTVSNQSTDVATKAVDPEIKDIALYQVVRYSQVCRIFAPVYRQITVQGLGRQTTAAERALGDKDILEAWKQYLAKYNDGRGFVLIGHSQGSFRLTTLIQRQIDKNAKLRKRLVSAILLGGNETVKKGSDRGGSFANVPTCRSKTQIHCLLAFSSFNQTPPDNSLFGRTPDPSLQVVCTNPAALAGGAATLDAIIPSKPFAPGTLIAAGIQVLDFPLPKVSTPWIEAKAAFTGECSTDGGASFLNVTALDGTPVPKPSPDATWGLHLIDANVAQGDLLKLVASQTKAYLRKH
jgi:hypothetical protein